MERQKKMMAEETDKAIKGTKVLSVDRTNHNEIDLTDRNNFKAFQTILFLAFFV